MIKPSRIYLSSNLICYDFIFKNVPKLFLRIIVLGTERKVVNVFWKRSAKSMVCRKGWTKITIDDLPETVKEAISYPFIELDIAKSDFSKVKRQWMVYNSNYTSFNFKV